MLKRIIKTHTARLDFCLYIIEPTFFLQNAIVYKPRKTGDR